MIKSETLGRNGLCPRNRRLFKRHGVYLGRAMRSCRLHFSGFCGLRCRMYSGRCLESAHAKSYTCLTFRCGFGYVYSTPLRCPVYTTCPMCRSERLRPHGFVTGPGEVIYQLRRFSIYPFSPADSTARI